MVAFPVLFILLALFSSAVQGVYVFDVYRLAQYEQAGLPFGSHKTFTNLFAATNGVQTEKVSKYILIVPAEELTTQFMSERFSPQNQTAGGLLVLLPERGAASSLDKEDWKAVEGALIHNKYDVPVWFAHRSETVNELFSEIKKQEAQDGLGLSSSWFSALLGADSYRLSVSLSEASKVNPFSLTNFEGRLNGRGRSESSPTIALFSYYDALSIAPGLVTDADANGSGAVALLELSRLFSKLYKGTKKTQGEQNLMFVMTGGGNANFEGTKQWLSSSDGKVDSLDFALCLDSIGHSDKIYLHVSRLAAKDPKAKKIYDTFSLVASEMNIPYALVHKKVNISNDYIPWEHEQFARKHVLGMTVSSLPAPAEYMLRSSLFDAPINVDILKRNIKFVAEVLARLIYGIHEDSKVSIFEGNLEVSTEYISSWSQTLSSTPRTVPFLNKKPVPTQSILSALLQEFKVNLNDVSQKEVVVKEPFATFYDQTTASMSAYRGKSALFDVLLTLLIALYCFLLHASLAGVSETIALAKKLFTTDRRRK